MFKCPYCSSENVYFSRKKQKFICEDCDSQFEKQLPVQNKKIFFSYAHDENEWLVKKIKDDIEKRGHSVWIDKNEIKAGDNWRESITQGLLSSNGIVSFLSRHSVRVPGVCLDELRMAISAKNGNIKTILLEQENIVSPPSTISDIQWLDLSNWREEFSNKTTWEDWYNSKIAQLCSILDSDSFSSFSGEVERLQSILNISTTDTKERQLISKPFIGRQWLKNIVEDWRISSNENPVFLLLGSPGIGKSCFAANQLHYNSNVVCGVFCEWDKESQRDPRNLIKTIVFKLASKLPDYRKVLLNRFECRGRDFIHSLNSSDLFEILLSQPLSELIDGGRERKIIIIDGLDEAGSLGNNELAKVLSKFAHSLPHWIKLLITSRPESDICQLFSRYMPYEYYPTSDFNIDDIKEYLVLNLSAVYGEDINLVIPAILAKCEGSFLYASMFVEAVKNGMIRLSDPNMYPQGLNAIYHQYFNRAFPEVDAYDMVRKIIEIIVSSEKMPLQMICNILNISVYDFHSFTRRLGAIITEGNSQYSNRNKYTYYTLCHKSIKDWLLNYSQSGVYFIDPMMGYKTILDYFINNINKQISSKACEELNDYMDSYIRNNIIAFFIKTEGWDRLADFLIETDTPLFPYWRCLTRFPTHFNKDKLLDYLWHHEDRDSFFKILQRYGETNYILEILGYYRDVYGIKMFNNNLFEVYVDITHMSGHYRGAVELYDDYLKVYQKDEIFSNNTLMHYSIRKLHHSMFFMPVSDVLNDAMKLHDNKITITDSDYNELLFLIGGNLGVLSGNFQFANKWLQKCELLATLGENIDFQCRSARKRADLYAINNDIESALSTINKFISLDVIPKTRYEIYLLGSLGEVYRRKREYRKAKQAFELLQKMTSERGIMGWLAHSYLAQANLYCEFTNSQDDFDKSFEYLNKAVRIYKNINQMWGIVNSGIVEYRLASKFNILNTEITDKISKLKLVSKDLQYKYEEYIIDSLPNNINNDYQLLFL